MKDSNRLILLHVTGCIVFLMLPLLFAPDFSTSFNIARSVPTQRNMIAYLLMIAFFYTNFFILIPRYFFAKKYAHFYLFTILWFIAVVALPSLILPSGYNRPPEPPRNEIMRNDDRPPPPSSFERPPYNPAQPPRAEPRNFSFFNITQHLFIFLALIFFSLILRIGNRWKQAERERLNAELLYLKAQMNPHFLFNTLNNIYSLALEKSDNTAPAVVKLSGMMRYVLSETANDYVSLEKDIQYIKNYIDLQQMRYDDTVPIAFNITGSTYGKKIAPLILISFIENAFKHGVNAEEDSSIKIHIETVEDNLHMLVTNNKVRISTIEHKSGLGIENTKNRLQLLYPSRHKLVITDNGKAFIVSLYLNLA